MNPLLLFCVMTLCTTRRIAAFGTKTRQWPKINPPPPCSPHGPLVRHGINDISKAMVPVTRHGYHQHASYTRNKVKMSLRRDDSRIAENFLDDDFGAKGASDFLYNKTNLQQLNRRERMEYILERDGCDCVWCRTPFPQRSGSLATITTDHLIPKLKGGPSWIENEVAACPRCNKLRGHMMPLQFLDYCRESKGWQPNEIAIVTCLEDLNAAIQERGGQRKARPHLYKQLKRLGLSTS